MFAGEPCACGLLAGDEVIVAGAALALPVVAAPLVLSDAGAVLVAGTGFVVAGAVGAAGAAVVSRTERVPVTAGSARVSAVSIKSAAATIVIFARMVCVPRGPKAVLETLLEKSAPASALPGCKRTEMTSEMQDRRKMAYKK